MHKNRLFIPWPIFVTKTLALTEVNKAIKNPQIKLVSQKSDTNFKPACMKSEKLCEVNTIRKN